MPPVVLMLLLAALWGASFLFMRVAAPVLGPVWLIGLRVLVAALFLLAVALATRRALQRPNARHYLVLGLFNTGLPFLCYGFAALSLPASMMAILNATAPIWGVLVGWAWLGQRPGLRVVAGLALGVVGVAVLVGGGRFDVAALPAVAACLMATLSYAIASHYSKRYAQSLPAFEAAHGSMWGAVVWLALPVFAVSAPAVPLPSVWLAVLALGVACTGAAYLLYFRLIAAIGAAQALTVTFLIPVFGVLWGALFLGERLGLSAFGGALLVLAGTALVTGFVPARLKR
ncbi:DMT family transporter [Jeongeupia wiesaeckerbachi]|uniref:DMT family transporter n=1 Tax=Jeongeupia wiesaeckerbachi TaxID=3051218 RepID=UPI003D805E62